MVSFVSIVQCLVCYEILQSICGMFLTLPYFDLVLSYIEIMTLQVREGAIMVQGKTVDMQRRKSKGAYYTTLVHLCHCC